MTKRRFPPRKRLLLVLVPMLGLLTGAAAPRATVSTALYGTLADGRAVQRHTLTNARGMTVEIIDYGAAIARISVPDRAGKAENVVLAPGDLAGFVASRRRYGAIVGRYAGRLRGSALVDGKTYPLAANALGVTLHGGDPGFDHAVWRGRAFETRRAVGVALVHHSKAGEQGFPGALDVTARYSLARDANVLTLDISATADRPTVANLTNHSYFNLTGGGSVACHSLAVDARRWVATDTRRLPTGVLPLVARGPLDFVKARPLGPSLHSTEPLIAEGLDHMLVLDRGGTAQLSDATSGRMLTVSTTEPGMQVYTANALDGTDRDAAGRPLARHGGIALEPQHFPDSPWIAAFPSTRVSPGHPLRWHTQWAFAAGRPTPCDAGNAA
ncbi:MAG: aldose epimerase family protein [Pseudomonadota bacterium]